MGRVILLIGCVAALTALGCSDGCKAVAELCDNQDNDCNGVIDDGLQRVCNTACGTGMEVCEAGVWVNCTAPSPGIETCNGLDDDCDGCFDERPGEGCMPLEQACQTDCGSGTEYCYMGAWDGCTAEAPSAEVCDGVDNDCDGQTDEGLDADSDGDGHYSTDSCSQPNDDCNDGDANIHPEHAEDCDGSDNDCDRQIDEGCSCTPPDEQACGSDVGECQVGTQTCQADGSWGPCVDGQGQEVPIPGAQEELCDNRDNDCDGQTDEGNPEGGGECGTEEGVCELGTSVCTDGALDCSGDVEPGDEICNPSGLSLDDDCDGQTDEGLDPDGDFEVNDTCALARSPGVLDSGDNSIVSLGKTLYRYESGAFAFDEDWYCVTATEASSACVPGASQCMQLSVRLDLPAGADHTRWEVCLYDHDYSTQSGSCVDNCGAPQVVLCTDPAEDWYADGAFYQMDVQWDGQCGFSNDSRYIAIVVRPSTGQPISDCHAYTLTLGLDKINQACE